MRILQGCLVSVLLAVPSLVKAVPCTYSLSTGGAVFASSGGNGSVTVNAPAGCVWSGSADSNWITLPNGNNGSGTLHFQVASNPGEDRVGAIHVAGATFTIEQVSAFLENGTFAGSMAHIASAGGWKTTFTLLNSGTAPIQIRLNFFDDTGNPLSLPLTFPQSNSSTGSLLAAMIDRTLNAGASLVIETTGAESDPVQAGWAQLLSTGKVGGFATFTVTASHQEAVVPIEVRSASEYVLGFDNTGGVATGVAAANTSTQPAVFSMIIRDDTGVQLATPTLHLPGHGHTSFLLTQNYPATAGKRGTIAFETPLGGQTSFLGLRANAGALTTLPLLADVTAVGGSFAQVASAGGWKTTFTFVNTGRGSAQMTLNFSDVNGNALFLPLHFPQAGTSVTSASSVSKNFTPNTSFIIETQGLDAQSVVVGSARLTTTGQVSGFAIFRDSGTGQEAVVPLETRTSGSFIMGFDNTNGVSTGIALANIAPQTASVNTVLRDDTGALLANPTINLPSHGQTSFLLTTDYASTVGKRGTVEFDTPSAGKISALGLRATPNSTLTTIPVLTK
jgi:hypothetical protein